MEFYTCSYNSPPGGGWAPKRDDASHAEAGETVEHIYSDIEWIVENGHAFDAEGIKHSGGETGDSDEYEEEETE